MDGLALFAAKPQRYRVGPSINKVFMKKKKLLFGFSVSLGLFLSILVGVGLFAYIHYVEPLLNFESLKIPPELADANVIVGTNKVIKQLVFKDDRLGIISDILFTELNSKNVVDLGVAGSRGAAFLDNAFNVKNVILFSSEADHVDFIDMESDGICEYISRGSWCTEASLIDHSGKTIWTYGGISGVDDMSAADIDNDGAIDFVVGFNGGGGVHRVAADGVKLWRKKDGNVWHVELVDTNNDHILEIVHSNAAGQMVIRGPNGDIIAKKCLNQYFSDFSICTWPTRKRKKYALLSEENTIWLFDFEGNPVKQYSAPYCGDLGEARGVSVVDEKGHDNFIVVVNHHNWERSILYWYDHQGSLIYQEILAEQSAAIASIELVKTGKESLLIGGNGKVWKYELNNI